MTIARHEVPGKRDQWGQVPLGTAESLETQLSLRDSDCLPRKGSRHFVPGYFHAVPNGTAFFLIADG